MVSNVFAFVPFSFCLVSVISNFGRISTAFICHPCASWPFEVLLFKSLPSPGPIGPAKYDSSTLEATADEFSNHSIVSTIHAKGQFLDQILYS